MYMKLMLKLFKTEIIKFLLYEGHNKNCRKLIQLISDNRLDLVKIIYSETDAFLKIDKVLDDAASYGLIEYVIYLSEMGASCSTSALNNAAESGHLDIVKWLHFNRSEGCTTSAMDLAARYGHLEIVKWLHQNRTEGCVWAIIFSSGNGHLSVVKYLVENRLGVDRIQEAIDCPIYTIGTREVCKKIQETKKYLLSL